MFRYIERKGGRIIKAIALTGKPSSANLALTPETLKKLRDNHGEELELWRQTVFGFGFESLTESEANYLICAESFDTIRDRILEAAAQR